MEKLNDNTCFLFADPSFLSGAASVLDMGGTLIIYNESTSEAEADARAIGSDWIITGLDIVNGIEQYEQESSACG